MNRKNYTICISLSILLLIVTHFIFQNKQYIGIIHGTETLHFLLQILLLSLYYAILTYLHEIGHAIAIAVKYKQFPNFKETLIIDIRFCKISSNFLEYLSNTRELPKTQNAIQQIAFAGKLAELLFLVPSIIILYLSGKHSALFFILLILAISLIEFVFHKDRKIIRNPESFIPS